jgi:hypothetical protein
MTQATSQSKNAYPKDGETGKAKIVQILTGVVAEKPGIYAFVGEFRGHTARLHRRDLLGANDSPDFETRVTSVKLGDVLDVQTFGFKANGKRQSFNLREIEARDVVAPEPTVATPALATMLEETRPSPAVSFEERRQSYPLNALDAAFGIKDDRRGRRRNFTQNKRRRHDEQAGSGRSRRNGSSDREHAGAGLVDRRPTREGSPNFDRPAPDRNGPQNGRAVQVQASAAPPASAALAPAPARSHEDAKEQPLKAALAAHIATAGKNAQVMGRVTQWSLVPREVWMSVLIPGVGRFAACGSHEEIGPANTRARMMVSITGVATSPGKPPYFTVTRQPVAA